MKDVAIAIAFGAAVFWVTNLYSFVPASEGYNVQVFNNMTGALVATCTPGGCLTEQGVVTLAKE